MHIKLANYSLSSFQRGTFSEQGYC